ncbi:MAG: LON peptidase substrate-binding domain-containing protein [Pirellulales bacterium]|nr:LON peptidase substrate-binding domain-containing protein [Pirellulales bacterium]
MFDPSAIEFSDSDFSGQARLFPLPNLVLFPHVIQPLHIFEERYREMMQDALDGDKLLTMCLLAPGWETDGSERPTICAGACLGRIVSWRLLDDGRYNLLLAGMRRVKVVSELDASTSFRQAHVQLCPDSSQVSASRQEELRRRLSDAFEKALSQTTACEQPHDLLKLFESSLPLSALTDILAYSLEFGLAFKQQLLEETSVDKRAQLLLENLHHPQQTCEQSARKFPPDFSRN